MKEPTTKLDIVILVLFISILTILSFYWNSNHRNILHKEVMDQVDSLITINKPLVHKIDSIADHVSFVDSSHFKWCDFVPNEKYKPFK